MDLKWYCDTKNNGTDNAVATLYKANGCPVLEVYEGKDCYFSRPCDKYACHVSELKIPYEVVNNFIKEQCSGVTDDQKNDAKLEFVCKLVKVDFDNQVNAILKLIKVDANNQVSSILNLFS